MACFRSALPFSLLFFHLVSPNTLQSQELITQTIKGFIIDADSRHPLPGMSIHLSGPGVVAVSDSTGFFRIEEVAIGTYTIQITGMGYEDQIIPEIIITSGKEVSLTVPMAGRINQLGGVTVTATRKDKPLNEFATASALAIHLGMAYKYPANAFDPARLAQNFAGVTFADDESNGIVIRGNAPKGVLWQLEGVEIPNPNHFSATGGGGGNISMLSSSTIDQSDFYTGAFPAEFGNALSGVFDLRLRNGNIDKREHSLMLGTLGIEASTEGPIKKGSGSSYLINGRYSTLAAIKSFARIEGIAPDYQDLSFKIHLPTRKVGTFALFGLGGMNKTKDEPEIIKGFPIQQTLIRNTEKRNVGIVGISNQLFLGSKTFVKTVFAATSDIYRQEVDTLVPTENYKANPTSRSNFNSTSYKLTLSLNHKFSNKLTQQTGLFISRQYFNHHDRMYDLTLMRWNTFNMLDGHANTYRAYSQWKLRVNEELNISGGLHFTMFGYNTSSSIEPRMAVTYQINRHTFSIAGGLHSQPEHLAVYSFIPLNQTGSGSGNKYLDMTNALHGVVSYAFRWKHNGLLKVEAYYQRLTNVPVEKSAESFFSMVNSLDIFDLYSLDSNLVNEGKGRNFGIDLTFQHSTKSGFNMLVTGSLYKSTFTTYAGEEYNSRFNRSYQVTAIIGKEWHVGKSGNKSLGVNMKMLVAGGLRESPIDYELTTASGTITYEPGKYYSQQLPGYKRIDLGVNYKINSRKTTHMLMLDFQNITNNKNIVKTSYDFRIGKSVFEYGLGLFPIFNYRMVF